MIFEKWAESYIDAGFSVIPLNGKKPVIDNWSIFSEKLPSNDLIIDWSSKYNAANIGLVCGSASGICAVDFDYEGNDKEKVENIISQILPPSQVRKRGKKGWTAFYKYNPDLSSTWINRGPHRLIDFLSSDKQTVLPPSIHPDNGEKYVWVTEDTLLDINKNDLPLITSEMIDKIKELSEFDFSAKDNPFNKIGGRHDVIIAYAWAIIEKCKNLDDLIEKIISYDLKKFPNDPYFLDKKYFKGKDQKASALEVAKKIEKHVKKSKKKNGVDWEIGSVIDLSLLDLKYPQDSEKIGKFYPGFSSGFIEIYEQDGKEKRNYLYQEFSKYFIEVEGFKIFHDNYFNIFNGKYYSTLEKNQLRKVISERIFPTATPNIIEQYYKRVVIDAQILGDFPPRPVSLINVKNGVLDIKENKIVPHSKNHFFQQCIDTDYVADAKCELWDHFLNDIFNNNKEMIEALQKLFGYVLIGGRPFMQKAFVFTGDGRNGKGIVIAMLRKILGDKAFSTVSMQLMDKPFSVVHLNGKLANIVEETPNQINSEAFKNIVGGGYVIGANKNKDEYSFQCNARLIFACNDLPKFDDKNVSILDRLFIIPFDNYYKEGVNLDNKLQEKIEVELPGILNWAIQGAIKVINTGTIKQPDESIEMKEEFRRENDPVYSWFIESLEVGDSVADSFSSSNQLYSSYLSWVNNNGHHELSKINFSRRVAKILRQIDPIKYKKDLIKNVNADRQRGYIGVKIKPNFYLPEIANFRNFSAKSYK